MFWMLDILIELLINDLNFGHRKFWATPQARVDEKYKSTNDLLMYAYAQATLDDETMKLTGFHLMSIFLPSLKIFWLQIFFKSFHETKVSHLQKIGSARIYPGPE